MFEDFLMHDFLFIIRYKASKGLAKMMNIEENAYKKMVSIFDTLAHEEKYTFHGYFAGDMIKVNRKSSVYPVFVGFGSRSLTIVNLSRELEKEQVIQIPLVELKEISMKKRFLSKFYTLSLKCADCSSYIVGVPHQLAFIPVQRENVELFLTSDFFLKP